MRHGSLFSGIGGFDLAAQMMGWDNVFHCEIDPFCQRILRYYWPQAQSFGDITKTDFTPYANRIDVLSGGFPCQPYSVAGAMLGTADSRHLWPQMLRAIKEIQPGWVVGENVHGLLSWSKGMVFHQIQTDLEAAGYQVWPYVLPACGINAPHKRYRIFFVAYSGDHGYRNRSGQTGLQANPTQRAQQWQKWDGTFWQRGGTVTEGTDAAGYVADSTGKGPEERESFGGWTDTTQTHAGMDFGTERSGSNGAASHASDQGLQGSQNNGSTTGNGKIGQEQSERFFSSAWQDFPTESPIHSRNDGLSDKLDGITVSRLRTESVKALGNAVVPQLAMMLFKAIEAYDKEEMLHRQQLNMFESWSQ